MFDTAEEASRACPRGTGVGLLAVGAAFLLVVVVDGSGVVLGEKGGRRPRRSPDGGQRRFGKQGVAKEERAGPVFSGEWDALG